MKRVKVRGFTLVELLVTILILGIVSAISYPSYIESVNKTHRKTAMAQLQTIGAELQRYRVFNGSYAGATLGAGGVGPREFPAGSSGTGTRYTVRFKSLSANDWALEATPVNGQAGDRCGVLGLSAVGTATAADTECW